MWGELLQGWLVVCIQVTGMLGVFARGGCVGIQKDGVFVPSWLKGLVQLQGTCRVPCSPCAHTTAVSDRVDHIICHIHLDWEDLGSFFGEKLSLLPSGVDQIALHYIWV